MPFVPEGLDTDRVFLGNCAYCDAPIYEDEPHYEIDGDYLCDEYDCLCGWADDYRHNGATYGW